MKFESLCPLCPTLWNIPVQMTISLYLCYHNLYEKYSYFIIYFQGRVIPNIQFVKYLVIFSHICHLVTSYLSLGWGDEHFQFENLLVGFSDKFSWLQALSMSPRVKWVSNSLLCISNTKHSLCSQTAQCEEKGLEERKETTLQMSPFCALEEIFTHFCNYIFS